MISRACGNPVTDLDSLVVRASASGVVDRRFAPWSHHTKGVKNGTSRALADACIKRVALGDKVGQVFVTYFAK